MTIHRSGIGLGFLVMISILALPVRADDFYVDAHFGSDETGNGSEENPWQHLQFAFDSIEGNYETPHNIYLSEGYYDIDTNPTINPLCPGNYENIRGQNPQTTYIYAVALSYVLSCEISNVTIRSIGGFQANEILIENCVLVGGSTVSMGFQQSTVSVRNCVVDRTNYIVSNINATIDYTNCIFSNYLTLLDPNSTVEPTITYSMLKDAYPGEGNIVAEPVFVRPEAFDFRLRAGSPGIDQGDPSDPVPPGGGSRIDMGCHEYPYQPQLFIDSVDFRELTGNHNDIPELGETIQPMITLCNYGEPATDLSILFNLDHPDGTMQSPNVDVGSLAFDECRSVSGLVFEITGYSGWGSAAELTGIWTDGTGTGTIEIAMILHGRDFYIDAGIGNDQSGDGSPVNPLKTIGRGRDLSRGSRLHPVTIRPLAGTYSTASNGETFPLWLEEYEDLRGIGRETILYNDSLASGYFLLPSRSANLSDFSYYSIYGGIKTQSAMNVVYHSLYSHYEEENSCGVKIDGSSIVELSSCDITAFSSSSYEPGDNALVHDCILETSLVGGAVTFDSNVIGPKSLKLYQIENENEEYFPSNTAINNIITAPTEIHNVNVFNGNICQSVTVESEIPFEISGNITYATMGSMESGASVTFSNNIGIRSTSMPTSFSVSWGAGPSFRNCVSLPLVFGMEDRQNFSGWYGAYDVDGCVGLFSETGVDYDYCWRTRNSVLYYLSEGNAACANTHYSDLMDCPEPTNLDEDPGFIGIARITDIGPDWFSDDTAAWEPNRYIGYYVNPNIYGNGRLFYCVGNSSDTIYVMGDPRTAAAIGDLFVIPDVRLRRIADGFAFDSPLIDVGDPDELDPDGTRRDIGPYGGPYGLTPMPVIPTWPPPDQTPTPVPTDTSTPTPTSTPSATSIPTETPSPTATPSPVASETPTQTPSITGVTLAMPSHWFSPGNPCFCTVTVTNADTYPLTDHPLFVILDVYGKLFFAPSFSTTPEAYPGPWASGVTLLDVIPLFDWPDTGTSASGILWYAALVDPTGTFIVGEWDSWEFGWE